MLLPCVRNLIERAIVGNGDTKFPDWPFVWLPDIHRGRRKTKAVCRCQAMVGVRGILILMSTVQPTAAQPCFVGVCFRCCHNVMADAVHETDVFHPATTLGSLS